MTLMTEARAASVTEKIAIAGVTRASATGKLHRLFTWISMYQILRGGSLYVIDMDVNHTVYISVQKEKAG